MARDGVERRRVIRFGLAIPAGLVLAACTDDGNAPPRARSDATAAPGTAGATAPGGSLPPTPACVDEDDETPAQTEGPYFTPGSPERTDLGEPGMAGTALVVIGTVLGVDCRPVERALLDFWQADDAGEYDNEGFRLRGHQFTAADGTFRLSTVMPGRYPGRTRHIHVKVQAPNGPVLTTQLYFPAEPRNAADGIFNDALLLRDYAERDGGRAGTFTFVVAT
jgi:protocatechuate 3,4-dioxygenase beta subunit